MRKTLALLVLAIFSASGCDFPAKNITYASRAIIYPQNGSIQISWAPSSGNPQGYKVEESTNGTDFYQIQMVTFPTATVTSLPPGATYYFRIRSYNEAGDSGYSAIIAGTLE